MACNAQEDEFDQLDKPGAERSRRRRATNEEWDSDLEDDLLSDDWGLSKKNQSDQSDEELDDNLLQSDDEANESYQDVSIDMNASASFAGTSLELSKSVGDKSSEEIFHYADHDIDDENATLEVAEDAQEEMEGYVHAEYVEEEEGVEYEDDTQLGDDQIDYPAEQGDEMYNDEVLDLEINDPLDDEFQDEDYTQFYATNQDMPGDLQTQDNEVYEEATAANTQEQVVEVAQEPEEVVKQIQEVEERKEVSDDEDEDDEESGRMRFKTERKEGTVIRLTDAARKRRNIPDTLELSDEAKAALREFEETERQRKQGKRGRRGGPSANVPFCDQRREGGRRRDQRLPLVQVPPSLQSPRTTMNSSEHQSGRGTVQQRRQPPPLLVPQRHPSTPQMSSCPPQQPEQQEQQNSETASVDLNSTVISTQQPKNIHINPHFRGPVVTPVQVPLMPTPNQPRPAVGPQRFLPTDEDEETRVYRLKIEEQKKLREEILKQKELRRQQQAGARKKELLERLAQQQQQQPPAAPQPANAPQAPQNINTSTLQAVSLVQPNIKNRLSTKKQGTGAGAQQQFIKTHQAGNTMQVQAELKKNINQTKQVRPASLNQLQFSKVVQCKPVNIPGSSMQSGKMIVPAVKTPELKPGVKRTVMQRMNSGGGDGPHINPKIRVLKLPTMQGSENTGFSHPEVQSQQRQHQQHLQKQQPVRKVTLTKGAQQLQQRPQQQRQQSVPQLLGMTKNSANQQNRVIMQGRGAALPGQMGRGRMMQHKQNLRVVECRPQPCVVSIEGLSSSTTDFQLKNLLMSVGPIQDFKMMREQRKAVAKFKEPAHASAFQQKFHRHMIDLSHINVALIMDE
ncbi:RNA-binding protein 33 [Rhincodon typus]|uniref:RNA-binding protein 33 n=1 Tax=Rhincodon typus TaxID=259920 RepID=UPI00202ECE91|nr:RNA-binding protein 33 [Rhincodon typus]